jgi:hypothetical protein
LLDIDSADFEVDVGAESNPKQFRSFRLKRQKRGKSAPRILDNALHQDIMLLVGAGASPNFVVYWLQQIISEIKKNELAIGRKADGKIITEPFDPDKKIRKRSVPRKRPFLFQL